MKEKNYHVYILTNSRHTVLYTGVTCKLPERIEQHKNKNVKGFTAQYNADLLVYVEQYDNPQEAIAREKQIKAGSRKKKLDLIQRLNPKWRDISADL